MSLVISKFCLRNFCRRLSSAVRLNYEDFPGTGEDSPLIIAHGMLGSLQNLSSISKALHRDTKRRVITYDARNHGESEHASKMSYFDMAADLKFLMTDLKIDKAILIGHSMGGRTMMTLALTNPELVEKLIILDISPISVEFDVTDATDWNMSHLFYAMKAVKFPQGSLPKARKAADEQLSVRIKDPALRAWLIMNVSRNEKTGVIGWKINLDGIFKAFKSEIAIFPESLRNKAFNKPTLFIGGANSDYVRVSDHDDIREQFPKASFMYVPDAGHWVHSQKPREVMDLIIHFIKNSRNKWCK